MRCPNAGFGVGIMKDLAIAILLGITFAGIAVADSRQTSEFVVRVNQEKAVRGTRIRLKFIELIEDSRCPVDVQCIWAGNARIKVSLSKNGRSEIVELNTTVPKTSVQFGGYEFRFVGLSPSPRSNIRINRYGYVATVELRKL